MARQIGHPGIPNGLRCKRCAQQIKREEMSCVVVHTRTDEDCRTDNEGESDCDGDFPARFDFVGDDSIHDCAEDSGSIDACWVIIVLDDRVAACGHPEGHDVVLEHLDGERVY